MKRAGLIFFSAIVLSGGCSSSHILITSNKYHFSRDHNKIMAVAVIKTGNDSARLHIEKALSTDLMALGYTAISAFEEFGPKGLANPSQQNTYLRLCSEGIDAVMIVTLIDKNKEKQFRSRKAYKYPDNYYYDRILNYKNIQADLSLHDDKVHGSYFWEAIFFNLATLEAECTIQSPSFSIVTDNDAIPFEKLLIRKMVREKILDRQKESVLKPF